MSGQHFMAVNVPQKRTNKQHETCTDKSMRSLERVMQIYDCHECGSTDRYQDPDDWWLLVGNRLFRAR